MIEYISYKSVNGLEFGSSVQYIIDKFGKPNYKEISKAGVIERLDYDNSNFTFIFDKNEKFSEFIISPQTKATVNGVEIKWILKEILDVIYLDSDPRIDHDGITLYDLGIYIYSFDNSDDDDFNDKSICFFAKGTRDEFKKDTKSFILKEVKQRILEQGLDVKL